VTRALRTFLNPSYLPLVATLLVIATLLTIGGVQYDNFLSPKALVDLVNGNAYLGIAAIGATFVILTGGIDLSLGSVVACTTILMAVLIHPTAAQQLALDPSLDPNTIIHGAGMHPLTASLIALVLGTTLGLVMGALIAFYELPPFMVTLAGMFFARAMGFMIHEASLGIDHPFISETLDGLAWQVTQVQGRRGPIPVDVLPTTMVMLLMYGLAVLVLHLTGFGRSVYAVGGDENSSRLLGVRVNRTKVAVYAISGFCASLAGVIATVESRAGNPANRIGLELDAIAAVVIGGTLLTGGRGLVLGTLLGVIVLALIQAFIPFSTWKWLDAQTTPIFVGVLMLVFILLQSGFSAIGKSFATQPST
jgi:simple sugar transport system permease protein